jgi:hypothetical protein
MSSSWTLGMLLVAATAAHLQAQALQSPAWGNLTASAILGWYAWHTAARTIPGLVRAFRDELAALRHEQRDERRQFHQSLAAARAAQHADQQLLAAALHELAACCAANDECRMPKCRNNDE